MKQIFTMLSALIVPFMFSAATAQAYVTTEQHAVQVTGSSALYSIEFRFGHENHDIHIPVRATETEETARSFLSYGFFNDENERLDEIDSAGIVFANAPIEDGQYVIPAGEARTLTLLVVASVPTDIPTSPIYMEVTYLPFTFDETQKLQLNPSELQYYRTPARTLPIQVQLNRFSISPA